MFVCSCCIFFVKCIHSEHDMKRLKKIKHKTKVRSPMSHAQCLKNAGVTFSAFNVWPAGTKTHKGAISDSRLSVYRKKTKLFYFKRINTYYKGINKNHKCALLIIFYGRGREVLQRFYKSVPFVKSPNLCGNMMGKREKEGRRTQCCPLSLQLLDTQ